MVTLQQALRLRLGRWHVCQRALTTAGFAFWIGARADGKKELIAVEDGWESEQSWCSESALQRPGDQNWRLATERSEESPVYGNTDSNAMHKTGNVLNCLPKAVQPTAASDLDLKLEWFGDCHLLKFPKATSCLAKDRTELPFYASRALATSENHKSDRVDLRNRETANGQDSRLFVQANHADDGLQTMQKR